MMRLFITALIASCSFVTAAAQTLSPYPPLTIPLKIEQVPAEFKATPDPWKFTEPFTDGQKPGGE